MIRGGPTSHAQDDLLGHGLALARVLLRLPPEQLLVGQHQQRGHAAEGRAREAGDALAHPLLVHAAGRRRSFVSVYDNHLL